MALNEVLNPSSLISATYTPTEGVTDVVIEGNGRGQVFLECQVSGGMWVPVSNQAGSYNINTPDGTISYRFRAVDIQEDVRVYLGP